MAVGLFSSNPDVGLGLFYGGGFSLLGVQLLGIAAVFAWAFLGALLLFTIIRVSIGLRVSEKEEMQGLDIGEHGTESYSGFQIFQNM